MEIMEEEQILPGKAETEANLNVDLKMSGYKE